MQHWKIRVFGRVQGVYFRDSTQKQAEKLGLTGFVRNESDGSVLIEAEGEEEDLQALADWCLDGPQLAKVERIETSEGSLQGYNHFEIRR